MTHPAEDNPKPQAPLTDMGDPSTERQTTLTLYAAALTALSLLGGFVYTSIVSVLLSSNAAQMVLVVRLLLWTHTLLLATFLLWQVAALDLVRIRPRSKLLPLGNFLFLVGASLVVVSLFCLTLQTIGTTWPDYVWLGVSELAVWLVLARVLDRADRILVV